MPAKKSQLFFVFNAKVTSGHPVCYNCRNAYSNKSHKVMTDSANVAPNPELQAKGYLKKKKKKDHKIMKPMKSMLWLWKQTLTLLWIQKTSEDNSHHGCLNKGAETHERFTSIMQLQKQCIHPPMEELFSGQQSFYGLLFINRNWHNSVALGA